METDWTTRPAARDNVQQAGRTRSAWLAPGSRPTPKLMPYSDFDIDTLAAYLHLTPAQVARMADRGRLPGRKISGQWRFSKSDIHHWLEDRIGASADDDLTEVENLLDRTGPDDDEISIFQMLPLEAIAVPLQARTRSSVISKMAELAANTGMLWDPEKMADAVRNRENLHPTALENGVALLHPRRPLPSILAEPFLALGITGQGIPFGQSSGRMTDVFFLICSTDDRGHLRTLARLSRLIADEGCLSAIRHAASGLEVREIIQQHENSRAS